MDHRSRLAETPEYDRREYDGYRVEYIDGEKREYEMTEDGEWERIDEEEEETTVQVTDGDSENLTATIDLSAKIGSKPKGVASATFNNGILEVEFEYLDE